ncbi:MAG: hypothetical protein JO115_02880 [Pseudonocardiales bacterium]|nr:hypothetical protein [Pseudonocardiales bacterium]
MSTIPPAGQDPLNPEHAALPAQQQSPPSNDPLVPASFGGWLGRVLGVVRRSFAQLAVLQMITAAVSVVFGVVTALMTPDRAALRSQLESGAPLTQHQISGLAASALISTIGILVMVVISAYVGSAAMFVVIRDAAGQPTTAAEGLRLGAGRALPMLGWGLLAGILAGIGFVLFILPGVYLMIVTIALAGVVVVVERAGIRRCFTLVNPRFLPTAGRVLLTALASIVYFVIVFAVTGGFSPSSGVIGVVVRRILFIPGGVVGAAVAVVTYAELRFHERGVNTGTLVAELSR